MSSSDKRRGGASTSHTSNTLRSSASARSNNSSNNVIAPPPRAQLGSRPSSPPPSNDNDGGPNNNSNNNSSRGGGGIDSDRTSLASTRSKDNTASSAAREKEAVMAQHLREKDDEIAELQRELAQLESEFARQVELLSQNESETAAFWQAKHSALNQQFLRTDTELRLLRAEAEARDAERAELQDGRDALRRELRERDDEVRRLHALNRGLKEQVSTSTRAYHEQTSDDQFGDDMARLGNGLQNWIMVHFRKTKIDLAKTSQSEVDEVVKLVPRYAELASTIRIHLLQSIVSSVLVDDIFSQYFVGLSEEQSSKFNEMERYLSSTSSDTTVNQWRAMTLNMIRKDSSSPALQAQTDTIINNIISRVNRLLDSITNAESASASANTNEARDQALRALVTSAVVLSRQLAVQKAVFKVTMPHILPHQQIPFDATEMEDVGGEDEEDLSAREICCVTCPSIVKYGDEHGGNPQLRNVIAKARVLCSPE
ncbi:hypothetical protein PG985_009161 [Apiospora marii]|uniref:GDP/GTP exchange factor Sec2 N-terminal domain-containing protein n=1 Tax=Apiospora marii TaxID=335849 RepID=A0ABR1RAJ0_9PEZI